MKRLIGGQPLYTKNEFSFSNATVLCVGNSGKSITYQIRSEHGNIGVLKDYEIEEHFNLRSMDQDSAVEPIVASTREGFSLTVNAAHAENIKNLVPSDLFYLEASDSVVTLNVSRNEWNRFSELLSL